VSLEEKTMIRKAMAAVLACADSMDEHAGKLLEALPQWPMDEGLRAAATGLCTGLKDTAGRVMFEMALLQAQVDEGNADAESVVRTLSGMDAAMMEALAAVPDVVERFENAAERDEQNERPFVLVIEAAGVMLQDLDRARAATKSLRAQGGGPRRS
jgi:hypothetical protein